MAVGSIWLPFSSDLWRTVIKLPHSSFPGKVANSLRLSSENLSCNPEIIFMGWEPSSSESSTLRLRGFWPGSICWRVVSSKGRTSRRGDPVFLCLQARAHSYFLGHPLWGEPRPEFSVGEPGSRGPVHFLKESHHSLNHQKLLFFSFSEGREHLFVCVYMQWLFFFDTRKKFAWNT